MSFLDAIMSISPASSPRATYSEDSDFWYSDFPGSRTGSGALVGYDSGLYVSAVFQAIRIISESLAKVPLHVYERGDDGESRTRVRDHFIATTLGRSPNPYLKTNQFRTLAQAQVLTRGNHYSQIVLIGGKPLFNPLHPDRMQVKKLPRPFFGAPRRLGYVYNDDEHGQQSLTQDEVFHLRGPMLGTDDTKGLSTIAYARETLGSAITQQSYGDALFRQGAQHRGVYSVPGPLNEEQHQRMSEIIRKETSGPTGWGNTLLLSNGATWHSTGMTATDAEFLLSRKFNVIEVSRWFNVQPHLLFDLERATFSNIEHQGQEFAQNTMLPHYVNWEQTIDVDLIRDPKFFSEFLLDSIVRADIATRYSAYGTAIDRGFMAPNEARQKENWNPLEGLDRPRISLNVAMIDEDGNIMPNKSNGANTLERPMPSNNGNGNGAPLDEEEARALYYDKLLHAVAGQMNGLEIKALKRIFTQYDSESRQKEEGLRFYNQFGPKLSKFLCMNQVQADEFASKQAKRFLNAVEAGAQGEILSDLESKGHERLLSYVLEDGLAEENGKRHEVDPIVGL